MEENTKLWNKKAEDLTVKESLIVTGVTPIVLIGGIVGGCMLISVVASVASKFRSKEVSTETTTETES